MNAKKSEMFAPGRRDSIDSDFHEREPSLRPQSTNTSTDSQSWPSSPSMSRREMPGRSEPQSCVARSPVTEDCATQQFLVWAAIKRNRSVRMAANDRLKCPLVRCGERFDEHETMLRHLAKCQHLKTGEYLCYECMQVERFNDGSRRCCSTQPSKRRKIVKLAKNFFSNIGNKARRADANVMDQDDSTTPPPAYDEMVHMNITESDVDQPNPQLELNGNEILELDAEVVHQLDPVNYVGDVGHQSRQSLSEAQGRTALSHHHVPVDTNTQQQCSSLSTYGGQHRPVAQSPAPYSPSGFRRPSLALNTEVDQYRKLAHGKYLTPSSSVRSQQSSQQSAHGVSPITPWSASSRASGVSADSWAMASGINTHMTSPTSPISPLGNDAGMTNVFHAIKPQSFSSCPGNAAATYSEKGRSKQPADYSQPDPMASNISDHVLFPSTQERETYSWLSSVNTELSLGTSVNVMFSNDHTTFSADYPAYAETTPATDAGRLLVDSVWEALRQHVESSFSKVVELGSNPLSLRLRQESAISIATKGFESLRSILNGRDPSDPLDYLCFVHLVYAFSLVLHEDDLVQRSEMLFKQALAYRGFLNSDWSGFYCELVTRIWDPNVHTARQAGGMLSPHQRLSGRVTSGQFRTTPATTVDKDALATVSQDFLDEFESLVLNSKSMKPADILASALWSTHMEDLHTDPRSNQPFVASANYIINVLSQSFRDSPGLTQRLRVVAQRVRDQAVSTVRRLEMELMQAGKVVLEKSVFFDKYVPQVRRQCTSLYPKHSNNPRVRYHTLAASFAEQLLQSAARDNTMPQHTQAAGIPSISMSLTESLDAFFPLSMNDPFEVPEGIENFLQPSAAQGPHQYHQPDPATPMPLGLPGQHMNMVSLNANIETPFPASFPNAGVSTPRLMTASHSPANISPAEPSEVRAPGRTNGTPLKMRQEQPASKKARITYGTRDVAPKDDAAQASTASPAAVPSTPQVEANSCCEICGYRPKGDPQWFKGSMAKHKKLQHSNEPPTIYRCPFPGCTSAYKNRQDNLRQHQIEKNHFVDEQGQQRRPNKRKRAS